MKSKLKSGPYYKLGNLEARDPHGNNNDGDNNNANDVGEVGDPYLRITEANYFTNASDGPGSPGTGNGMALPVTPTGSFPGFADDGGFFQFVVFPLEQPGGPLTGNLPQARAVSDAVMALGPNDQNHPNSFGVNEWFDFFGQALTHDVAEASTGNSGDLPLLIDGLPFPFGRTPGELDSNGVRQQLNEETAFLDLSFVYGNNQDRVNLARADLPGGGQSAKLLLGPDGMLPTIAQVAADSGIDNDGAKSGSLEVLEIYTDPGFAGLPDPATNPADNTFDNLFYTGDNRANQQPPLIALQTIWAREHNYQVDKLTPYANKYGWSQDQLFEAARAITEAEWQKIVYDEYLPKLIGNHADDLLAAYKSNHPDIPAGIINEWTTVAFRFGHDQSSNDYFLLNEDGTKVQVDDPQAVDPFTMTLGTAFQLARAGNDVPGAGHNAADIDAWIRGLTSQFTQEIDGKVADGNREALFGGLGSIVDLEAFDIQRGRDHGVGNYNLLRDGLGLETYDTWNEFKQANDLDQSVIDALISVYGVDDATHGIKNLDSIVGGLLEKKYYDSQLGETFTLLNAIQFEALREGDEFFYTNRFEYDKKLMAEIENTSFADILARNTDIDYLYRDAFDAHTRVSDTDGSIEGSYSKDLAIGTDWGEMIKTYDGADDIYAGKGNDYLFAGKGNDWIWTGKGRDIVVLEKYSGCDVVKDFETKYDKLDLTDYGLDTWKEVKKAMHKTSDGVVIQLDCDNEVTLVGVKMGQLSSKNFIYDDDYGYAVV